MDTSISERNRAATAGLATGLAQSVREINRDFEARTYRALAALGFADVRPAHGAVLAHLGTGAVRVTALAAQAHVTQQAMGKMLKELESMGYIARQTDSGDRRARVIGLTPEGVRLASALHIAVETACTQYRQILGSEAFSQLEEHVLNAAETLQSAAPQPLPQAVGSPERAIDP